MPSHDHAEKPGAARWGARAVAPAQEKPAKPDKPEKGERRHRSKSTDKDGELNVVFRLKKPSKVSLSCGSESRSCEGSCTVTISAGTVCALRSTGFASKRYKFEDLERKARRGKAKIDVTLYEE